MPEKAQKPAATKTRTPVSLTQVFPKKPLMTRLP